MQLNIAGSNKSLEKKLKKFNIKWVDNNPYAPKVFIQFGTANKKSTIAYAVVDFLGNEIVPQRSININKEDDAAKELAYGLFNIVSLDSQSDIKQAD